MKKMTLQRNTHMTLLDGCQKHYEYFRQRNLREGTLRHYQQAYNHFYMYFGTDMPLSEMNQKKYNDYVQYKRALLGNDITLKTYNAHHFLHEMKWRLVVFEDRKRYFYIKIQSEDVEYKRMFTSVCQVDFDPKFDPD